MKQRPTRDTKIVWSVDSRSLTSSVAAEACANDNVDCIRVVYRTENIKELCAFVSNARKAQIKDKPTECKDKKDGSS